MATSLPISAEVFVSWLPVSCIPSPESPARRTVAERSSRTEGEGILVGSTVVEAIVYSIQLCTMRWSKIL